MENRSTSFRTSRIACGSIRDRCRSIKWYICTLRTNMCRHTRLEETFNFHFYIISSHYITFITRKLNSKEETLLYFSQTFYLSPPASKYILKRVSNLVNFSKQSTRNKEHHSSSSLERHRQPTNCRFQFPPSALFNVGGPDRSVD